MTMAVAAVVAVVVADALCALRAAAIAARPVSEADVRCQTTRICVKQYGDENTVFSQLFSSMAINIPDTRPRTHCSRSFSMKSA